MLKEQDKLKKGANNMEIDEPVCTNMNTTAALQPQNQVTTSQPMNTDRRCFLCNETTHYKRDCPKNTCYNCGRAGHTAQQCRTGQRRPDHSRAQPYNQNRTSGTDRRDYSSNRDYNSNRGYDRNDRDQRPRNPSWNREREDNDQNSPSNAQKEQFEALKRGNETLMKSLAELKMRLDKMQTQRQGNANRA
jgi:zinc knuckle protein